MLQLYEHDNSLTNYDQLNLIVVRKFLGNWINHGRDGQNSNPLNFRSKNNNVITMYYNGIRWRRCFSSQSTFEKSEHDQRNLFRIQM